MKKLVATAALLALTGCSGFFTPDSFFAPKPLYVKINGDQLPADAPPDARQGWHDGCESGYAVYGTNVYKSFYGYKRDTSKVGNYLYETQWYNGYNYCRQAINTLYNDGDL